MTTRPKPSFGNTLAQIIKSQKCNSCGACVTVCPTHALTYKNETPTLTGECAGCGLCAKSCPPNNPSKTDLEELVFGRPRKQDEPYGISLNTIVARSTDPRTKKACQDGGAVTTLLILALKKQAIQGAAITGTSRTMPLYPVPTLANTRNQIIRAAGTKYFPSPNLFALRRGIDKKLQQLALVGPGCQIEAARRIQAQRALGLDKKLKLTIGLLCSTCFSYESLINNLIRNKLEQDPHKIAKMNIKGKLIITTKSGKTIEVPLQEIRPHARLNCTDCTDFSAELADISAGGLGLNNWSMIIARTQTGNRLISEAVKNGLLETKPLEKHSLDLLANMATRIRNS